MTNTASPIVPPRPYFGELDGVDLVATPSLRSILLAAVPGWTGVLLWLLVPGGSVQFLAGFQVVLGAILALQVACPLSRLRGDRLFAGYGSRSRCERRVVGIAHVARRARQISFVLETSEVWTVYLTRCSRRTREEWVEQLLPLIPVEDADRIWRGVAPQR